jgi:hypothetical protein
VKENAQHCGHTHWSAERDVTAENIIGIVTIIETLIVSNPKGQQTAQKFFNSTHLDSDLIARTNIPIISFKGA